MDLKVYRHNLIVATEGRGFWILDDLPVVEQAQAGQRTRPALLFKPADGVPRGGGGAAPTFYYWFKDEPTSPVTLQVMDAAGAVVYTTTGQPGTGSAPQPPSGATPPCRGRAGWRPRRGRARAARRGEPAAVVADEAAAVSVAAAARP